MLGSASLWWCSFAITDNTFNNFNSHLKSIWTFQSQLLTKMFTRIELFNYKILFVCFQYTWHSLFKIWFIWFFVKDCFVNVVICNKDIEELSRFPQCLNAKTSFFLTFEVCTNQFTLNNMDLLHQRRLLHTTWFWL